MNSYTPSVAELEARLAKLESQNRRWKHLGLLFLLIAGSGFLLAQAPRNPPGTAPAPATAAASYDTLVVHRLELRDKAGKLRGLWTTDDEGAGLALYDAAGKLRAELDVFASDPRLVLYDTAGKPRAALSLSADGPGLALYDTAGKRGATLDVTADGPGLALYDAAGKPRAALADDSLLLGGVDGKVPARLWAGEGGPYLRLEDAQQFRAVVGVTELETVRTGENHTTSAAAVTLFGKDGKVIWRAP